MTNADKIRNMSDLELTELLLKAEHDVGKAMCDDFGTGCYYTCTHNRFCEKGETRKISVMKWLQEQV